MSQFRKARSYGPRITLTERQQAKVIARFHAAGMTCFIEHCPTGSVYVSVGRPEWERNIHGEWYSTLDCGCGDDIAKIRLSGHDEGRRCDSTHCVIGSKSECLASLDRWIGELIAEHSGECLAIVLTH